jgi:DNA-binding transcriptional MerR regulator
VLARIRTSLPIHPTLRHPDGSVVQALGRSRSGALIWPVRGGAPDDDEGKDDDTGGDGGKDDDEGKDDDTSDGGGKDDQDDDKELGPAGEKALQAEKTKRRTAQAALREFRELGLSPAELKKLVDGKGAGGKDDGAQPDLEAVKREARAEAAKELQRERVLDKIEAKAARAFADPDDAAALLLRAGDLNDFLDDDGKIDVEAIEDGLKALLEKKPYLAAAQGDGKRFKGSGDGGTRNGGDGRPKQLSRDDLKRMSPQEIEKARLDGRLADLLTGKK